MSRHQVWKMTRAQSSAMDAAQYAARSKPFGSAVRDLKEATLLTVRTQVGVDCYMITSGGRADLSAKAADVLGNAVGAKAVRVDESPDLSDGPVIARMVARPNQSASRDTQTGADPAEVARTIARVAEPGSWVAVTLRRPSGKEIDRTREWNHKRAASVTHHSLDSEVLVASFFAGAASTSAATFLLGQVVSALPGMDVDAVARIPSDTGLTVGTAFSALGLAGLGFAGDNYLPGLLTEPLPDLATTVESLPLFKLSLLGAAPLAGVSALAGFHLLPTARQRLRKSAERGALPRPATGGRPAPKPKPTEDGAPPAKVANPYPLASTSFLVGPSVVAGVVAPQGGAEAGAATTGSRGAPPALREDIGPMIGTAGDQQVHLSAADFTAGVGIFGVPDSGKAQPLDSRVPVPVSDRFPDGWATVGQLQVGDQVYTQDGSITDVVRLSPINADPDLYDIHLVDGQTVTADANHLWKVSTCMSRIAYTGRRVERRAKVRADNMAEAARLREMAAELGSGSFATANELALLVRLDHTNVRKFVKELGLPSQEVIVASNSSQLVGAGGTTATQEKQRTRVCYPVGEFLLAYADRVEARGDQRRFGMRPVQPLEQIMSTRDMLTQLHTSDGKNNIAIALPAPLDGDHADLAIDPYVLGAWLGDGTSRSGAFTQGTSEACTDPRSGITDREHLTRHLYLAGHSPRPGADDRVILTSGLRPLLAELGLIQNKHIPASYLRASAAQRLALLQGLMDTDGTISSSGSCELALSDEGLARDALELIRSLGIKAGITSNPAGYRDADGNLVECQDRHRIHFSPRTQVFRLPRKARRVRTEANGDQSRWLAVVDVTPTESRPARCITVEHPSGMYLTEDFVPTHNSVAIRALYGWGVLERVSPSGKPGRPGRNNTLIAFENKGEGAAEYMAWGHQLGDHPRRIDLADRTTPAIDLFAGPSTPAAKAKQVAEAMQYAFPEGDIRRQSLSTITLVLTVAQFVTDQIAGWADLPAGGSVVEHAAVLLGAQGDEAGMKLATALKRAEMEGDDPLLAAAMAELAPLYGDKVTVSQRRQLQEAPRTKIETLVEAADWFAPDRPKMAWADILTRHENVVVNTGVSATGELVSAEVTTVIGSMLLYTLRDAIMRHCSGWKDQGRFVSIFVDELALLAAGSPEVVTWLRNQGRSYGVAQFLATQYPDQLHEQVRKAVLSFGVIYWFRQTNPQIAEMAAEALSVDGSDWSKADVFNLPAHTAIIAAQVNKVAQPAVPVAISYWEDDRSAFPADQGYPSDGRLPEPEGLVALTEPEPEDDSADEPEATAADSTPAPVEEAPVPAPEYEGDPFAPDRFSP